jgi:hypothetical protein
VQGLGTQRKILHTPGCDAMKERGLLANETGSLHCNSIRREALWLEKILASNCNVGVR